MTKPKNLTKMTTPWNGLFQKAKAGDADAAHCFFIAAEPLISPLYKDALFRNRLGKDEIHSIATFAIADFLADVDRLPGDDEVPYLLKQVIRRKLLDCIRKMDVQKRYELSAGPGKPNDPFGAEDDAPDLYSETPADDDESDPEARCLKSELSREVIEAIGQLSEKHQKVINGLFFQHKKMKEIAQEIHCTTENVRVIRVNALARLHKLLESVMNE